MADTKPAMTFKGTRNIYCGRKQLHTHRHTHIHTHTHTHIHTPYRHFYFCSLKNYNNGSKNKLE